VVALGDKTVTDALQRCLRGGQEVLDLTRLSNASELNAVVHGLNW